MDMMYLPILEATKDIEILNLTMKIICEAMLENIYNKQIKFSICGALNLLKGELNIFFSDIFQSRNN